MPSERIHLTIEYRDLGLIRYRKAWDIQEGLFKEVMDNKLERLHGHTPVNTVNYLVFCEHPPVFTLGKSGRADNLLINEGLLKEKGIEFHHINRGGDITYHGPGQIVGYPILDLELYGLGIKSYIYLLEEAVITLLKDYGIHSCRLKGATGVWLDTGDPLKTRKICAIGVRASRHVTMHGFAFNVNTDLGYYRFINPCGFVDKGVTSMARELGDKVNMDMVKEKLLGILKGLLLQG